MANKNVILKDGSDILYPKTKAELVDGLKEAIPSEIVWFTYGTSTHDEIIAAHSAGKVCAIYYDEKIYYLTLFWEDEGLSFTSPQQEGLDTIWVDYSDEWHEVNNTVETVLHKVISISSSSTDQQYPSAKCVYNNLAYITTAPSSANTTGMLKVVVLSSEPTTKYDGYLYIITGA